MQCRHEATDSLHHSSMNIALDRYLLHTSWSTKQFMHSDHVM